MDGFKKRLSASVRFRLSFSLSVTIIAVAIAAGIFSFLSAFDEAQELQDDMLHQIAILVDQQRLSWTPAATGPRIENADDDSTVYVQALGAGGSFAGKVKNHVALPLPETLADGLQTLNVGDESYRVLVKTLRAGSRIAVSQETDARNEMAYNSALRTLLPFLILVPVLLLLVAQLIRKLFRPIMDLASQIDKRTENDLRAVRDGHLPLEVRPFILAINRLLARVAESLNVQRRFVADAAHELRSPMTALSLQAQRLEHLEMSAAARERLQILQRGIERGQNLLNQLLSFSRAQAATELPQTPVSIHGIFRTVLEDLMPLAKAKHIDLGVLASDDIMFQASEPDLFTIVRNLVDNAVRYTPEGGRVDLAAQADAQTVTLRVSDTGPGIPLAERARIFDPFYRVLGSEQPGSGLGLAIVKTIAERIGARVTLEFTDRVAQSGLTVTVTLATRNEILKK